MLRIITFFTLIWMVTSFVKAETPARPPKSKAGVTGLLTGAEVEKFLSERFAAGKNVVFRSRDGKFYGMDSDSVISLEKDYKVVLGEYGSAYQGYRGNYAVTEDGVISITLKGYRGEWPEMKMAKEKNGIRMYAKNGDGRFVFGGRAGAVETKEMKPFWPFRLADSDSTPQVTPIWSGGNVKTFTSPTLPEGFEWKGDHISFRLDFNTLPNGTATVQQYWTPDVKSNRFSDDDWRLPVVKIARQALESWTFYPFRRDGEPIQVGKHWNFEVSKIGDEVRWVIQDDVVTVFDNMPREAAQ